MKKNNYALGLDLGVGSVGWSCVLVNSEGKAYRILDLGSRIFDPEGGSMEDRRIARGARRQTRRRRGRRNRIRKVFEQHKVLTQNEMKEIFAQKGVAISDVYELKLKGLKEPLSSEELYRVILHYAKGRGFKSNRKSEEADKAKQVTKNLDDETRLLKANIETQQWLDRIKSENPEATVTSLLMEQREKYGRIRNTSDQYFHGITRAQILEEAQKILDHQILEGCISNQFRQDILDELSYQNSYAVGPMDGPYHNHLKKMIGKCRFTGEQRAARTTCSYELYVLVSALQNLRFYPKNGSWKDSRGLSNDELKKLVDLALDGKKITFKRVHDVIGSTYRFKGLSLTKKQYAKVAQEAEKQGNKADLKDLVEKEKLSIEIGSLKQTNELKNHLKKTLGKTDFTRDELDQMATILSLYKTDEDIRKECLNLHIDPELTESLLTIKDKGFTEFGKYSLKLINDILPYMIQENLPVHLALEKAGYHEPETSFEATDTIPVINEILDRLNATITNRSVKRTLVEARKIVNAIIQKYGKPIIINIEMARELTKNESERRELIERRDANEATNSTIRYVICHDFPDRFRHPGQVSTSDIMQYKLFIEQRELCPYTLAMTGDEQQAHIRRDQLFTKDVEVDHILPYSKTGDDRMINKVLVLAKTNQEKRDRIPYEAFGKYLGYQKFANYVMSMYRGNSQKKERLLLKQLTDQNLLDYRPRTLNDTRYIAKTFRKILQVSFPDIKVKPYTGQITAKLRGIWGLNNLTHSLQSKDYKLREARNKELDQYYEQMGVMIEQGVLPRDKVYKELVRKIADKQNELKAKNRSHHLHHALDATLLAVMNDKIRRGIEIHEAFLREKGARKITYVEYTVDDETGEILGQQEIIKDRDQYLEEQKALRGEEAEKFPLPYNEFRKEAILRVFERDELQLRLGLADLTNYVNARLDSITPITVSHYYDAKVSGRLHKDTIKGEKIIDDKKFLTTRVNIASEKFKVQHLEALFDKESTQKYVYDAVKHWLGDSANGKIAYEHHNAYPTNKNGNPIVKVKLIEEQKESFEVRQRNKQYVDKTDVLQVHIFKRPDDDRLYFVGMDLYRILNKGKNQDLTYYLWFGQGSAYIKMTQRELEDSDFYLSQILVKGQPVHIVKKDGGEGDALVVGASSGMFEVSSILGDGYDVQKLNLHCLTGLTEQGTF